VTCIQSLLSLIAVIILTLNLSGCGNKSAENNLVFVTRSGMGVDKWASIWLIKRHIAPNAEIRWLEEGHNSSDEGVLFDTEKSLYKRTGRASTFSSLIEGFNVEVAFLPDFMQLVHDIEINYWGPPDLPYSDLVENQFRRLQAKFGQEKTPTNCYLAFFDNLQADMPVLQNFNFKENFKLDQLIPESTCADKSLQESEPRTRLVAEWPVETVLKALQLERRVIFIDVRESDEFAENHIPGAINLKIRDMDDFDDSLVADANLVVPYCIKDFRGFEMARLLKKHGVDNVILMRPYGLKGWVSVGLPTAGYAVEEEQALSDLAACANNPGSCLKPKIAS
jgi:rhodanese-related sulfurtransferase